MKSVGVQHTVFHTVGQSGTPAPIRRNTEVMSLRKCSAKGKGLSDSKVKQRKYSKYRVH